MQGWGGFIGDAFEGFRATITWLLIACAALFLIGIFIGWLAWGPQTDIPGRISAAWFALLGR